jgi:hypothetical protein
MAKEDVKIHELKSEPQYFEHVFNGSKLFELRENDRKFAVGDILMLKEWLPKEKTYTGREVRARVTYLTDNSHFVQPGIVAMGIELL